MGKPTPPTSAVAGHPALPPSVTVSRDRDHHVVYAIDRGTKRSLVLVIAFFAVAVAAAFGTVAAIRTRAVDDIGIALSLTSLALVMWAAFLGADRTHARVVAGVLVLHTSDGDIRYELRNPHVRLEASGDPRSKKWRLRVTGPAGNETTLRRAQADPAGLLAVLALYRPEFAAQSGSEDVVALPDQRSGADDQTRKRAV